MRKTFQKNELLLDRDQLAWDASAQKEFFGGKLLTAEMSGLGPCALLTLDYCSAVIDVITAWGDVMPWLLRRTDTSLVEV